MEYFIGLTFDPSSIHYQKVDVFRKRYDSKYNKADLMQLTLLPPFTIDFQNKNSERDFVEELSELLDAHLYGLSEISQIEFNGISFAAGSRAHIDLTPIISIDIIHCQESLYSFLKDFGVTFKKTKNSLTPILPIARFDRIESLDLILESAKSEFSSPFVMEASSFVLFEKNPKEWKNRYNLFDFEERSHFFFVNNYYA